MNAAKAIGGLVVAVVVCYGLPVGAAALLSPDQGGYYTQLARPAWSPPGWVFGPVWTALYALMAVSVWLVWRVGGPAVAPALTLFGVQLLLNAAWSPIFFGLQDPGAALAELAGLWVTVVGTVVVFWRLRPVAGVLLLPYLVWISFAGVLNHAVWRLSLPG